MICGHDHFYYRTARVLAGKPDPTGIVHVVTGGGGASLYEGKLPDDGTGVKVEKRFHLVELVTEGEHLAARVLSPQKEGEPEVIDSFEIVSKKIK